MRRHLLIPAIVLLGLTGGCASNFRYDADEAPPPAPLLKPTTMPSNTVSDVSTFGGVLRATFIDLPTRLYEFARGNTPSAQAMALEDSKLPDRRREGINLLVARPFGQKPPYTTRYGQMAQFDADPSVRATAIRALNYSRDGSATAKFIAGLSDDSAAVRLEAAKALSNVPDERAATQLLKIFNTPTEDIDLRIAAADALRQYRSFEIARALINVLSDRDFALAWQARQSLRTMTGRDQRYDQAAWLSYLTGPEKPLG